MTYKSNPNCVFSAVKKAFNYFDVFVTTSFRKAEKPETMIFFDYVQKRFLISPVRIRDNIFSLFSEPFFLTHERMSSNPLYKINFVFSIRTKKSRENFEKKKQKQVINFSKKK